MGYFRERPEMLHGICLFASLILSCIFIPAALEAARILFLEGYGAIFGGLRDIHVGAWLTNFFAIFFTILLFWSLTNRLSVGILVYSTLTGILLFAHIQKIHAIDKPLAMGDIFLVSDVLSIIGGVIKANLLKYIFWELSF